MPSRSSVKTIATPIELMGDDAWITYRPITINEARELQEKSTDIQKRQDKALSDYAKNLGVSVDVLTDEQKNKAYDEAGLTSEVIDFSDREFAKYILDWNWVFENNEPMPKPCEDYTVLGKLYPDEYQYIMSLFRPKENTEKN